MILHQSNIVRFNAPWAVADWNRLTAWTEARSFSLELRVIPTTKGRGVQFFASPADRPFDDPIEGTIFAADSHGPGGIYIHVDPWNEMPEFHRKEGE